MTPQTQLAPALAVSHRAEPWTAPHRPGVIVVLAAVGFVILLSMTMLSVDTAYIHLVRTELRVATDSAAKAGAEALLRTQDVTQAVAAAQSMAAANTVAGRPLQLSSSDITFGNTALAQSGTWTFQKSVTPYNSVRVDAALRSSNSNGAVKLFFAGMIGRGNYEPTQDSTATVFQQDVLLCIDRSHSMCFDLSGAEWVYPTGKPWTEELKNAPHPTKSRWAALNRAVKDYLDIVGDVQPRPRIGLVTWASEIGTNSTEYRMTGKTSPKTTSDAGLSTDYSEIRNGVDRRSVAVMLGGTEMSAGLDMAISQIQTTHRPLAKKVIVLMTDGQWNKGRSPVLCAEEARDLNIVIHTVTFLPGAIQTDMSTIAKTTGGRHYHADNEEELREVFRELAKSLPVVLTE